MSPSPLKRDLSDLPLANVAPEADQPTSTYRIPTKTPTVGPALAAAWFKSRTHDDHLPLAIPEAGPHRGSDAGKCARAIGYRLQGFEQSDPPTIADHWRMDLGSLIHEQLQAAITEATPGAKHELFVDLNTIGVPGSARMDTLNPVGMRVSNEVEVMMWEGVEIKTINGFGFKATATNFRKSGPEGPRESHVIQLALNTCALAAAGEYPIVGGRLVYLSMELVSPDLARHIGLGGEESRFVAEWFFPLEVLTPIAEAEAKRLAKLREQIEAGEFVKPVIPVNPLDRPDKIMVVNPNSGAAVTTAGDGTTTWSCGYCSYISRCASDFASLR